MALEFDDSNFEAEVLKSETPVVVDFSATWCGPCQQLSPIIDQLAGDYEGRVKVGKLNVDDCGAIAARYQIRGIPTILVFSGGEVHEQMVGASSKENIIRMVDKVAATEATA